MYKIAILGCENSHANIFLDFIKKDYPDVKVEGVYSDDRISAEKLNAEYGVYVADSYDEFVGKIDGLVIVARHGGKHYEFAKPYLKSGIPMFIDKPIVISEADALSLKEELIENNVKVCGGTVCKFAPLVHEIKNIAEEKPYGKIYGGLLRGTIKMNNEYGEFYFYAQHLVQVMGVIFGYYPKSVQSFENGDVINTVVRYNEYDINLQFVENNDAFYAGISCEKNALFSKYDLEGCFEAEFYEYYKLLTGGEMTETYDEFIASVFIMNAIERSFVSKKEEKVNRF